MEEFFNQFETSTQCFKSVLVQFKKPSLDERLVVQNGGAKIKLTGDTRSCSYRDSFKNFVNNLTIIKKTAVEQKLNSDIIQKIYYDEHLENVETIIQIYDYDVVCVLINKAQSLSYSQAAAVEDWVKLKVIKKMFY